MTRSTTAPATASGRVPLSLAPAETSGDPSALALTPAEIAALAIGAKHAGLLYAGFDLGAPTGPIVYAGHGGYFRVFEHGRIYWHATTGAREVHGGVLSRYLEYGGHDLHPGTLRREYGFPVTDEIATADGRRVHSVFEWGAIYWINGGVGVFGPIWQAWKALSAELGPLGYPVTTRLPADGLDVVHFEGGCIVAGGPLSAAIIGRADGPALGRPAIVNPSDDRIPVAIEFDFDPTEWGRFGDAQRLVALLRDRYVLQPVNRALAVVPLVPELARVTTVTRGSTTRVAVRVTFRSAPGVRPAERTLYDLGVRAPGGVVRTARPHAFYAKGSWTNFGVVHATDIHVSRRVDGFSAALEQAGRPSSAGLLHNTNDAFRDLVRHLNRLHAAGDVDMLMATGDLVDYGFEAGDNRNGGGNFALFEDIILGRSPYTYRTGEVVEELRVPIFTSLGNHDYRPEPYLLRFEVEIRGWFNRYFDHYRPFNLLKNDAIAIQGGATPKVSTGAARRMVTPARPSYYFRRINPFGSYVVPLGAHRLVMLDTGPDVGLLDSNWDALALALGWHTEDEGQFASGSPNSEGVDAQDLALVRTALQQAGAGKLVLVGMHAPPLNPKGDEYPNYFRETARVGGAQEDEIVGYLARHDDEVSGQFDSIDESRMVARARHPQWFTGGEHFKRRQQGDLLDSGVSRGATQTFLEICAGAEGRPVDLVLFGHVHRQVEYRLSWDAGAGEVRYHTDFYTESPGMYYPMSVLNVYHGNFNFKRAMVDVLPGAPPQGGPSRVTDHRGPWPTGELRIEVPPYWRPLAESTDPRGWWELHRPLLMQTGPLGPTESNDRRHLETNPLRPGPSFRGVRLISVRDDVIARITSVSMAMIGSGAVAAQVEG